MDVFELLYLQDIFLIIESMFKSLQFQNSSKLKFSCLERIIDLFYRN